MAGIFSLRNWVMKQLMKTDKSGIMRIPDKGKIDFGEMLVREQLFRKGIDPKSITRESQLDNILNTPVVPKSERVKPKKSGEVIEVDFDKNKNWFKGKSEGTKSLFATDKEFADELRSLRLNIIRNDPQFNLEIAESYKLPGGKTYAPYPDKEPGKLLSPTQRQNMLDEIKNLMKDDEYRSQFGGDFNFEEITDEMFRIKKAQGGRTGFQNGAIAFPDEEEEMQSGLAPGRILRGLGHLAMLGITGGGSILTDPKTIGKTIGKAIARDQVGKKIVRPVILKGLDKAYGGGSGGTSIGGGQQTSSGIAGGAISHSAAKEARGDMSGWGLAEGGRLGLSYLLAEDTNERMPFLKGKIVKEIFKKVAKPKVKPKTEMDKIREWGVKEMEYTNPKSIYYDERRVLQDKYPGITDDLLNKILIDDNPQRKAEVLATIDEAFRMLEKGKGPREIINIFQKTPRTKNAEGGITRVPFKMGRRAFLKIMGGVGAGIGALKTGALKLFGKEGATVAKEVTQVPIKNIEGMPSWFKPLVNKVIKEGEQMKVTEYDRLITHKTKLPESKTDVYVNQDLSTGDVWVDIGVGKHGWADGHYGQPVRLEYKASEVIEPDISKTGKVKSKGGETKEEFWVEEAEFTGGHPENVKFEESVAEKYGNHGSDFSEVERFATGKNVIKDKSGKFKEVETLPTTKKADQLEWARGRAEAEADAAADMADDFASGGRVPRSGGGIARMLGE